MYIADGVNIRVVSQTGIINTYIGQQGQPTHWSPILCDKPVPIDQVSRFKNFQEYLDEEFSMIKSGPSKKCYFKCT